MPDQKPPHGPCQAGQNSDAELPLDLEQGAEAVEESSLAEPIDVSELDNEVSDSPESGPRLAQFRIDRNRRFAIPFLTKLWPAKVHYLSYESLRGYVGCNGPDCVLCAVGQAATDLYLLPVYDPITRSVQIMLVTGALRPTALRPQLVPLLKRLSKERIFLTLQKTSQLDFAVHGQALPAGADDGAEIIRGFLDRLEEGAIHPSSALLQYANEVLADIPEVRNALHFGSPQE
jgi:hypothetical protein